MTDNDLAGNVSGTAVQVGVVHGNITLTAPAATAPAWPVARGLPARATVFLDREREQHRTHTFLRKRGEGGAAVVLCGPGGIGKSALALQLAHDHGAVHPAMGQVHADAHAGSDVVLAAWVAALGYPVPGSGQPPQAVLHLWRSLTAEAAVIAVADDLDSPEQVTALRPSTGVLLATSRLEPVRFAALAPAGVLVVDLAAFGPTIAADLVHAVASDTGLCPSLPAEQVEDVVCGAAGVPHALVVAAATLAHTPPTTAPARRMRVLASPPTEDSHLDAELDTAYTALPPPLQQAYRRLGVLPHHHRFTTALAAALFELDEPHAQATLEALARRRLCTRLAAGRWRVHDLVADHARTRALADGDLVPAGGPDRNPVLGFALDHLLHHAARASHALRPLTPRRGPAFAGLAALDRDAVPSAQEATVWFADELTGLLAAITAAVDTGMDQWCWQLVETCWPYLQLHGRPAEWARAYPAGPDSARRCGRVDAALLLASQGLYGLLNQRDFPGVLDAAPALLEEARRAGDLRVEASVAQYRAIAATETGDLHRAAADLARAREIYEAEGLARGAALVARRFGVLHQTTGNHQAALRELRAAVDGLTQLGDALAAAVAQVSLARSYLALGHHDTAGHLLADAASVLGVQGGQQHRADLAETRADHARLSGDVLGERAFVVEAIQTRAAVAGLGDADVVRLQERLHTLPAPTGEPDAPTGVSR
ncbi:hypothetical protein GCM10022247_35620 [Allokutzneria multivorans]|uniref:Tetratricopeptide repeat protein n=1 Tax=Allokutzneria multivorans TaxID=1142134 RepID=A0ABP7SDU2_9PSEU